jgi:2-oxoglutarate ferredoxin oxidoreductase subunit delta
MFGNASGTKETERNFMKVMISHDFCKGCGICVELCPAKALRGSRNPTRRGFYPPEKVEGTECKGCKLCEMTCPDLAIWVVEDEKR